MNDVYFTQILVDERHASLRRTVDTVRRPRRRPRRRNAST
jgi:hypothetical protein